MKGMILDTGTNTTDYVRLPGRDTECYVRALALQHGVTEVVDRIGRMAVAATEFEGDDGVLDTVERLLVNLTKKGVLSKPDMLTLLGKYLLERKVGQKD